MLNGISRKDLLDENGCTYLHKKGSRRIRSKVLYLLCVGGITDTLYLFLFASMYFPISFIGIDCFCKRKSTIKLNQQKKLQKKIFWTFSGF